MKLVQIASIFTAALASLFPPEPFSSGLVDISNEGQLFYWLFPAREAPEEAPLVVWLSGGPGAASSFAAVKEIGPFILDPNGTVSVMEASWTSVANLLFIDQPLGVGWSSLASPLYLPYDEQRVGAHLRTFFFEWFSTHPEYINRPLILAGESFAGHYVPFFAASLLERPLLGANLTGVLLGNPDVDPVIQSMSYIPFSETHGLVNDSNRETLNIASGLCTSLLRRRMWPFAFAQCNWLMNNLLQGRNLYDIREPCEVAPLCYNWTYIETFFNRPEVRGELVEDERDWSLMRWRVFFWLLSDTVTNAAPSVAKIIRANVPVTAYYGDQDMICNWVGGLNWMTDLEWDGKEAFDLAELEEWQGVGQRKRSGHLQFVKVAGAGHMVPMDHPDAALQIVKSFVAEVLSPATAEESNEPRGREWRKRNEANRKAKEERRKEMAELRKDEAEARKEREELRKEAEEKQKAQEEEKKNVEQWMVFGE